MNKNTDNFRRTKKKNGQGVYVIAVAVLMVVSVVIAVISASSRRKPVELTPSTTPKATAPATLPEQNPDTPETKNPPATNNATTPATAEPTEDAGVTAPETNTDVVAPKTEDAPVIATLPVFTAPAAGIVAKAHSDSTPVFSTTMNDYRVHTGIDVQGSIGAPVFAVADGTVSQIWDDPMMGKCLSLSHSGGAVSIYKNLGEELPSSISVGASVNRGDVIGSIGESALIEIADEPHVHYELKIENVQVNPEDYIDFSDATVNFDE